IARLSGWVLPALQPEFAAERPKEQPGGAKSWTVEVGRSQERQVIDGFGGSLAFWGYDADERALRFAFDDLGATIVRVPGEVSAAGETDEYRAALERVARVAPKAQVLLSFW